MRHVKIILSDLHLSAGHIAEGNPLEDFDSDRTFAHLLETLISESKRDDAEIELILNGDTFEFWQVPALADPAAFDPQDHYTPDHYLSTSEEDSRRRMALMIAGHPMVFGALASFLRAKPPRRWVTIVKGNHDIQLHWRAVQDEIRCALGADGDRADYLTFEERRIARDGIYVEHGSQYVEAVSHHPDFEEPHDPDDPDQLIQTPGAKIAIHVFNRLERDHYWIDGIKPVTAMIWYLFRYDFWLAVRTLFLLLRHIPRLLWLALPIRRSPIETLQAVEDLERELTDVGRLEGIQRDEVQCQAFYERVGHAIEPCGAPPVEAAVDERGHVDDPLLARGLAEEHRQHARLLQVAAHKIAQERVCVVVFGHTHAPCVEVLPGDAVYLNTGAWTWHLDLSEEPAETWRRLIRHGERYQSQRRLTYARIDYRENGTPIATLREALRLEPDREGRWERLWDRLGEWLASLEVPWKRAKPE